jgi:hypothetical protein
MGSTGLSFFVGGYGSGEAARASSNNSGANNRVWYPTAEAAGQNRFAWGARSMGTARVHPDGVVQSPGSTPTSTSTPNTPQPRHARLAKVWLRRHEAKGARFPTGARRDSHQRRPSLRQVDCVTLWLTECSDAGIAFAALNSAQHVGASLGMAVLNRIAAATTRTMLSASARAEALVHGCASAAGLAVLVVRAGAAVATSVPTRTDSLLGGVHP